MPSNIQILPGVKAIAWLDCRELPPHAALFGLCGQTVPLTAPLHPVEFSGEAECSCSTEKFNGDRVDTATLKFRCAELLPLHLPLGFAVTTPGGDQYLIGARETPYTRIKVERLAGTPSSPAGYSYEITHTARCTMLRCQRS